MSKAPSNGEFDLIAKHFAPLAAGEAGALGLMDDAAVLDVPSGSKLVATTDAIVEGVHFLETFTPEQIAHRVLAVNLSDLAAMGARPKWVMLSAAFTDTQGDAWIEAFAKAFGAKAKDWGVTLVGGDTVKTPGPLTLSLTALGLVEGEALTRSGAKVGDTLYVSGMLGGGQGGLNAMKEGREDNAGAYLYPEPRLDLGQALLGIAKACVDISDGLVADLGHICEASNVAAVIEAARLPLAQPDDLQAALIGGDDYELLFSVPEGRSAEVESLSSELGLNLTVIGRIEAGSGVRVLDGDGKPLELDRTGYQHF